MKEWKKIQGGEAEADRNRVLLFAYTFESGEEI